MGTNKNKSEGAFLIQGVIKTWLLPGFSPRLSELFTAFH